MGSYIILRNTKQAIMRKNLSSYSDRELVEMLQGNKSLKEAAFTELYDRYGLRINAYCISILNNSELAADVFQETFLKFYQKAQSDKFEGSVIGFLVTIARNLCLNVKRDTKLTVPIEEFEFSLDSKYEDKELADLVMMAMDLLDSNQKEAIVLRIFNDLRYKEIAGILDVTPARARYLVFNGRQKIKDILYPYLKEINNIF